MLTDFCDVALVLRQRAVHEFPGDQPLFVNVKVMTCPATHDVMFLWEGVRWHDEGFPTTNLIVQRVNETLSRLSPEDYLLTILHRDGEVESRGRYGDSNFHVKPVHRIHYINPGKDTWESQYTRGYEW